MTPVLLYKTKGGKVEWLEKKRIVVKTFHGYIYGEELRAAFNAGYEQLKKSGGKKWLSDNRGLPVYKPEDVEWINTDWLPRMLKAGWKYWASTEPESNVGQLTMEKFRFFANRGVHLRTFAGFEEALAWLVRVDHVSQRLIRSEYRGIDLGSPVLLY